MSQYPPSDFDSAEQPPRQPPRGAYEVGQAPALATIAMVLGIIALVLSPLLIFGVAALVCGIIAVGKTGGPNNIPGRGRAVAGIAMGGSSFVLMLVVMLLIAILLPALGAARRTARRMQNSTQLREIHQGLLIAGQSNNYYYPGLDSNGKVVPDGPTNGFGTVQGFDGSGDGDTVEARFWYLLDNSYVAPAYAISPSEIDAIYEWSGGPVTSSHYSYAMLSIDDADLENRQARQVARHAEWKETANSQAIVISDRNINPGNPASIHNDQPGQWKGSMLWNDNHVGFEQSHIVTMGTKYGNASMNNHDDLFVDDTNGDDAWLIYEGD